MVSQESRRWCECGDTNLVEWTCEGNPRGCAQALRCDGNLRPLSRKRIYHRCFGGCMRSECVCFL